jgi:hypothetical protein
VQACFAEQGGALALVVSAQAAARELYVVLAPYVEEERGVSAVRGGAAVRGLDALEPRDGSRGGSPVWQELQVSQGEIPACFLDELPGASLQADFRVWLRV